MKTAVRLLALTAILILGGPALADDKPATENKLANLERFVGEWEVDGKWSDGKELHARAVYEWGLAKKILVAKTFVRDGDKEYQRYESVLAWHPEKKSLYEITFAYDGAITEVLIDAKGDDTLQIGYTPIVADKPSPVRQVIQFVDKDHYRWTVSLKDGAEWKQIIEATWKRKEK